jgi:hypothetical protein
VRLVEVGEFAAPVYVTQPPGEAGDLYVVEKGGRIIRVADGAADEQPFLDIGDEVSTGGEQGLLSMAFGPDFARSGRFYIDYTDVRGDTRIEEIRARGDPPVIAPVHGSGRAGRGNPVEEIRSLGCPAYVLTNRQSAAGAPRN